MKSLGIKRLIYVSAYGVGEEWMKLPFLVRMLFKHSNIVIAYKDHEQAENVLANDNFIDFTILQPTRLLDALEPTTARLLEDGEPIKSFMSCTRISVAWKIFDIIDCSQLIKQKFVILN
jgi:hypothetical protein